MGGSSSSTLNIDHKVWPTGITHETNTKIFNREAAMSSYLPNERLSFGKIDPEILKYLYNDKFFIIDKGQNYLDGYRTSYSDVPECCTTNNTFIKKYNVILSCSDDTKTFNNDFCDDTMYKTCTMSTNSKCNSWIRSQVQRKGKYFNAIKKLAFDEKLRSNEYIISFIEALRDFATDTNGYNGIADEILDSYSDYVKNTEYKCAFPSVSIIEKEKNIQTPRECWYKDCSLAPQHKLKLESLKKREMCNITICDININSLNMSTQDIQIICKNKYNNQTIDVSKNNPLKDDMETIFFIPEFKNTLFPIYILFSLCFLINK
jgi:hypothetical protein